MVLKVGEVVAFAQQIFCEEVPVLRNCVLGVLGAVSPAQNELKVVILSFVRGDLPKLETLKDDLLSFEEGEKSILSVESVQVYHLVFDARHSSVSEALTRFFQPSQVGFRPLEEHALASLNFFRVIEQSVLDVFVAPFELEYRVTQCVPRVFNEVPQVCVLAIEFDPVFEKILSPTLSIYLSKKHRRRAW